MHLTEAALHRGVAHVAYEAHLQENTHAKVRF